VPRSVTCLLICLLTLAAPTTALASTGDPASNRPLSSATYENCSVDPSEAACIDSALADINAAHAAEGVKAMVLPSDFATMSVPVQLLNLANLERVDRGLTPILGLSAALDRDAQTAAAQNEDPMPTNFYGNVATANWAGGFASTLEADYEWMYDDGLGSGNLDCTSSDRSGCWGHRHDILWNFSSPIAMGAGYYANGSYGPSMTELFVGGDTRTGPGEPDAPVARPSQPGSARGPSAHAAAGGHPRAEVTQVAPARSAVALSARCAGTGPAACKLTVTIAAPAGHAGQTTRAVVTLHEGQSRVVRITLARAMRRLLDARHSLRVRVVIRGSGTLLVRTLTLRTTG
jgi:hypothetical protein